MEPGYGLALPTILLSKEILYYGQYRDDCLVLWCGIEDKLDSFLTFLNE